MKKIIHLIAGLNTGGAEMMLYKLISYSDRKEYEHQVISLTDLGPVGQKILDEIPNAKISALGMRRGLANPLYIYKLYRILKQERPDVLQTWMYHANLLGFIAGKMSGVSKIIWGIRTTRIQWKSSKLTTYLTAKLCSALSRFVNKTILCSQASLKSHVSMGYDTSNMVVIPNGFDITRYKLDTDARKQIRQQLNIPDNRIVIGHVGRWHPVKDYGNLIKAVQQVSLEHKNISLILCGDKITDRNEELLRLVTKAGIEHNVHLLGRREDVHQVMSALDIFVLCSLNEGFPNVVGEAMACELPCVVTDVGDCADIVGESGAIVPPNQPQDLAKAISNMIKLSLNHRKDLGREARRRVMDNFEIRKVVLQYEQTYK